MDDTYTVVLDVWSVMLQVPAAPGTPPQPGPSAVMKFAGIYTISDGNFAEALFQRHHPLPHMSGNLIRDMCQLRLGVAATQTAFSFKR
jgi:hypothetical protein